MACTSGSRSVTYHRWIVMMSCPQWLLLPRVQEHDPQQLGLDHCLGQTCIGSRSSHRLQPEWLDKNKFISLRLGAGFSRKDLFNRKAEKRFIETATFQNHLRRYKTCKCSFLLLLLTKRFGYFGLICLVKLRLFWRLLNEIILFLREKYWKSYFYSRTS